MKHPDLTPELIDRLAADIGRKGWEVNQKLTELMAGRNVTLATLGLPEVASREKKIERLRRYLAMVSGALKRVRTDDYGLCLHCGQPIRVVELTEMPWRERHPACEEAMPDGE